MTVEATTPLEGDAAATSDHLLEVRGLRTSFDTRHGAVRAVTGVDFHVDRGEILGLVGESGCGKSVTSLSILRLIAKPGVVEAGEVIFDGRDLLKLDDTELRKVRGDRISMIFQQPQGSLNPVMDVGDQIGEVLELHRGMKNKAARGRAIGADAHGGHPRPRATAQELSPRDVGWHGPAGDDRHGPRLRAGAAHRGRAHDRPRRDHPGPDPGPDADAPEGDRHGHHPHHPRPGGGRRDGRPRRRDVCRRDRRAERRAVAVPGAQAPLHPWPDRRGAGARRAHGRAHGHPGQRAQPHLAARGLPVRAPLRGAHRPQQRAGHGPPPRAAGGGTRPPGPLLAVSPRGRGAASPIRTTGPRRRS